MTALVSQERAGNECASARYLKEGSMNRIIYIVGLIVIVLAVLSFLGLA